MKKFFLIAFFSILCSFQSAEKSFVGFGELVIGAEIQTISNLKEFKKLSSDTYTIKYYKISEQIGLVENLYIKIHQNKIYQVSFSSYEGTNTKPIEEIISKMRETDMTRKIKTLDTQVNIFQSADKKITFSRTTFVNKVIDYMYFDTEINSIKIKGKKSNVR